MVLDGAEGLQIKLLDFGLALMRSHIQMKQDELTGTLSYMAPELFEGRSATAAADLFSVGIIAYELFTDRHPFDRGDDFQLVASILRSEPDWAPLQENPALSSLIRSLLAKSPAARPSADDALLALSNAVDIPIAKETAALRESTLQAARFVGREEPMAALRASLDAAQGGAGEVWLLAGESGVGKSRLMEELRVYSLVQGVRSARGQAVSEGGVAYGVWRNILRLLCICTELSELDASVLKAILPDLESLLERSIPEAPALSPQAAQLRLVNVIESLLLRQTEPLLLLFEDLHWADAESLALLRHLAPSCRARPILMVASYRDDERPNLPQELLGCPVLKLNRLSAASIAELCLSMLGDDGCTPELVTFLAAETEGNVFFLIEVMRALAEDAGELGLVASHHLPKNVLTGGIQAIVRRRLARLPAEARPLLKLAAVAGRQLDLLLLRCFEPHIEPWLYLAADAAVLEASDQTWRFAHDKIRESLLLELAPDERQRLHLEIARALEATYPGSAPHAAELAEHFHRGGSPAKAAFYLVEAGVQALSQGATDQAATLLQQALAPEARALLPRVQTARAYHGMVQATMALGRFGPCTATYEQFASDFGLPMPTGVLSLAAAGRATLARLLRSAPAIELRTEEDRRIWTDVAHATRWACEAYVWGSLPIKSIIAALRGTEIAGALGDRALQGYFLTICSYIVALIPLRAASRKLFEHASRLVEGTSGSRTELDFRRVAGALHLNASSWELAKSQLGLLTELSRQSGDEYSLMAALAWRCITAFRQDDEATFETLGSELSARARRNRSDQFCRAFPLYQGIKALRRRDGETALRLLCEAESYIKRSQDTTGRLVVGGLLAHAFLIHGNQSEALRRAEEALALIEANRFTAEAVGEGVSGITEVYLRLWEEGSAAERLELTMPLQRALLAQRRCARLFPACAPRTLLWHARVAWNQGAVRLARRLGAQSLRSARQLGMPYDVALAQEWIGRFAAASPGADARLMDEARGIYKLLAISLG